MNADAVQAPGLKRVVPFDPDASFLVHKLEGTMGPDQGAMMPEGATAPVDPDCRLRRIREWIAAGAPRS